MNRIWSLVLIGVALSASAIGYSATVGESTPLRQRATHQYRCEQSRNVIALERSEFVSLMVAGRSYDLEWINASTARGHGLVWRVSKESAELTRASSGFALARRCARVNAQF